MSDRGLVDLDRAERFIEVRFDGGPTASDEERENNSCSCVGHFGPPNLIDNRPLVGYR